MNRRIPHFCQIQSPLYGTFLQRWSAITGICTALRAYRATMNILVLQGALLDEHSPSVAPGLVGNLMKQSMSKKSATQTVSI